MSSRKTSGVVLRSMDLGESDTLVTFYTRDYGLARIAVSGSKKTTSFKSGLLQNFCWNQLEYYQGEGLGQLNKLSRKHSFQALREDLKKMSYGSYVLEFYYLAGTAQTDVNLFRHLIKTLYQLEKARNDKDFRLIHLIFRLLLLEHLGFSLRLGQDSYQGEQRYSASRDLAFSVPDGGLVLAEEVPGENSINIDGEDYQIMQIVKNKGYQLSDDLKISQSALSRINKILDELIAYHLELNLRSRRFLDMF